MCVAIPLQLKKVDGNCGIGIRDGVSREIRLDFIKDPKPGEYVIVHAGFAIENEYFPTSTLSETCILST